MMITTLQRLNHYNPLNSAWLLLPAVLVLIPPLLFSSFVPDWAPNAALIGLTGLVLLRSIATGGLLGHTPVDWPLMLLLVSLLASLWAAVDRETSLPRTYAFIANLALLWAIAAQRNTPWLRWSGWLLLWGGLILSVVFLLGADFGATKLPFINRDIYTILPNTELRPFWNSEGFNANMSGGVLALFWAPSVVLIWAGYNWQQRDLAKLVTVGLSVLLLLTQARGALVGVLVALPVITLLHSRRWLWVWAVAGAIGGAGVFYLGGPDMVLESILGQGDVLGDSSLQSRQELWERAIYIIRDFPLTGVGLGMVEPVVKLLYPNFIVYPEANFKHVHNIYLQAGAELGLPGLIAHLSLYLLLLYLLLRRVLDYRMTGYYQALALGLLGTLITFLAHGFFEVIIYAPRAAIIVWGLFGLMIAVATSTPDPDETNY